MPSSGSASLDPALLADFFAECDELLAAMQEGLAQLEARGSESPGSGRLEELFRHTHTLKGNAAIVGLRPAEELAHAMESVFRALEKQRLTSGPALLETLLAATQQLERILTAHREGRSAPARPELLAELRALAPEGGVGAAAKPATFSTPAPPPAETPADPLAEARARGLRLFRLAFIPSRERDAAGLNVKSVRERLQGLGEILRATPIVQPDKTMLFEFVVGLRETDPPDPAAWAADGLELTPFAVPPPPPGEDATETTPAVLAPSLSVRVELTQLDELMRLTGELVIQRSRLENRLQQSGGDHEGLKDVQLGLGRALRALRETLARVRLAPIGEIFGRMPFVLRELERSGGKRARMQLEGNQTPVDKYLVERLKEPLLHLVRNAYAHGLETPAERRAAGKDEVATITLQARGAGEYVVIQVRDDGRGIDSDAVLARAAELGLPRAAGAVSSQLLQLLCAPGFSTRTEADLAAGRGVGMAVVAKTVRDLGGTLKLETWPGRGTEFTLRLPVSLSIGQMLIVEVGEHVCAAPQGAVEEIVQVPSHEVRAIQGTELVPYRDGLLPVIRLRRLFGGPDVKLEPWTLLVVASERGLTGLLVDRVRGQREVVVRPLTDPLLRVPWFSGATELGDGRPILILDPNALTEGVVRAVSAADRTAQPTGKQAP